MSSYISLLAEPSVGETHWAEQLVLSLGWHRSPTADHHVAPRAFQVELIYVYRTKVAHGVCLDTHVQCCTWSQLLHNHVFTKRG